ncbi:unnamed protein product [Miscanthus lutarioriparius]|uniref:RED-like N-terminal domain-containing protein n=1 Tax=Miscanthus lutarioriparius TaxID=422564 RepID=A0A811SPG8_9POAL|nr:unnamed protein product [Miscanthus lutarioriparius]
MTAAEQQEQLMVLAEEYQQEYPQHNSQALLEISKQILGLLAFLDLHDKKRMLTSEDLSAISNDRSRILKVLKGQRRKFRDSIDRRSLLGAEFVDFLSLRESAVLHQDTLKTAPIRCGGGMFHFFFFTCFDLDRLILVQNTRMRVGQGYRRGREKMSSKKKNKEKMMRRKEEKKEEPETPRYCDHAKECREDQNPDYEPTELGSFDAVVPPGTDLWSTMSFVICVILVSQ